MNCDAQIKDYIFGLEGGDTIRGGNGGDCIYGGVRDESDSIILCRPLQRIFNPKHFLSLSLPLGVVQHGEDVIYGENGADLIYGDTGADTLYGTFNTHGMR